MRILSILITILIILSNSEQLNAQNTLETDSVAYVANRLMSYDVYINSFEISDAELDWIENDHPNWVVKFFPQIITQYDCTLYTKFALAASLYQKYNRENETYNFLKRNEQNFSFLHLFFSDSFDRLNTN